MSTAKKTKARIQMIEMGIVPAFTGRELEKMMSSLSDGDRKIAKRKFRKAWRRIYKSDPYLEKHLKDNSSKYPTKRDLRNRAVWVVKDIIENIED
jgi:hypothetical protein